MLKDLEFRGMEKVVPYINKDWKATVKITTEDKVIIIKCVRSIDVNFWATRRDKNRTVFMVSQSVVWYPKKYRGQTIRNVYSKYGLCPIVKIGKWK